LSRKGSFRVRDPKVDANSIHLETPLKPERIVYRIASAVGQVANLPPIGNRRATAVEILFALTFAACRYAGQVV
jgi:hypothetical protein